MDLKFTEKNNSQTQKHPEAQNTWLPMEKPNNTLAEMH